MKDLLKRLNIDETPSLFEECYEKVRKDTSIPAWLTEEFILELHRKYDMLPTQLNNILSARNQLVKNPDLVLFAKVLYDMLKIEGDGRIIFKNLKFPSVPENNLVGVFPMLAHFGKTYDQLKVSGIPEDVLKITFQMLDLFLNETETKYGSPRFSPGGFVWTNIAKSKCLFRVGRFNFEIFEKSRLGVYAFKNSSGDIKILMDNDAKIGPDGHWAEDGFVTEFEETDEYYRGHEANTKTATVSPDETTLLKSEWMCLYKPGDDAISIHIPTIGSFDPQVVDDCLERGKEFLKKNFPDLNPTVFFCYSWLLAPELPLFLKPESNILSFYNRFFKFPDEECCCKDVFTYVFKLPMPQTLEGYDFETLPQNNSLQKAMREHYLSGKMVHEAGGIFPY